MRVTGIRRFLDSVNSVGMFEDVMSQQVRRMKDRVSRGIDLDGQKFAPLASGSSKAPLSGAARLFEGVDYSHQGTIDGIEFRATLMGRAAKVVAYQNRTRRFFGFSRGDRDEVKRDLINLSREFEKKWR